MWRRRAEFEIHDIKRETARRHALARFAYFVLLPPAILFAVGFLYWIGILRIKLGKPPPNISFIDAVLQNIPVSAIIIAVLVIVGLRRLRDEASVASRVICTRCHSTMSRSISELCDCGGRLEPVAYRRCIDDVRQHT
jgi:hypothetical protein